MSYVITSHMPTSAGRDENMWLEEAHYGHRLWDQQSPWLVFLEFLCVADYAHRTGVLFNEAHSKYSTFHYLGYGRIHLRNILFNNEQRLARAARSNGDSNSAWRVWLDWMEANAHGLDAGQRDFGYLRKRFDSFQDFATLVGALRSCAVEGEANKRWSSRFIFPFGPAAIYEDRTIKAADRTERDYVNFGRSGELLYLMLARSRHRAELAELLPRRVLDGNNKWNHLVRQLQPDVEEAGQRRGTPTYLPYDSHPVFDLIAEDWLALLRLDLPGFDVVPFLVLSGTFGLLLYQLHTSAQLLNRPSPPMICEIVAPRKGLVRELSIECYEENAASSLEAIGAVIERVVEDPQWSLPGPPIEVLTRRRDVLQRFFWWKDEGPGSDPDDLLRQFRQEAKDRHRRHFGQVHRSFGRGVGLVSRRGTNRFRYAPTDALLKCLIYANVGRRTEFGELLDRLYRRYGLVFGEREASAARSDMDKKPFQQNANRLEHRLGSLGLVKRLSDACAYVENPYALTHG